MNDINDAEEEQEQMDPSEPSQNLIFGDAMEQSEICKMFLEELLKDNIEHIECVVIEHNVSEAPVYNGVRLDIHVKDNEKIYNVEIFGKRYKEYASVQERSQLYQSAMDKLSPEFGGE